MALTLEAYGEKYYLIKGKDSFFHKDKLKEMGAKWNVDLKCWLIQKSLKSKFEEFINNTGGNVETKKETKTELDINKTFVSKKDFLVLLSRVEKLETLMGHINKTDKSNIPMFFEINKQKEPSPKKVIKKKEVKIENEETDEKPLRLLRNKKKTT
jgi:hypothetical protein